MNPAQLVQALRARGVTLRSVGDKVRIRPAGVLTAEEREALIAFKPEILALLRPDAAEVARVLGLPIADLDRVLTVAVPWLDRPLYVVPTEADAEALIAAGETTRGAVWTRQELLSLLSIPGITKAHAKTVALAKYEMDGDITEIRLPLVEVPGVKPVAEVALKPVAVDGGGAPTA